MNLRKWPRLPRLARLVGRTVSLGLAILCTIGCRKSAGSSPQIETELDAAIAPMDSREAAQWSAAAEQDPEELMRLEDLVGCQGLRDRSSQSDLRATAIRAMKYCPDFSELPWLVDVAADKNDDEARAALETIDELAARPRRATDPEDADELHTGCAGLLAFARSPSRARDRRVLAVRALRMLSDRGCVRREDIPRDVDVR